MEALYELKKKYTDYKINPILTPKNMASYDWHCGVEETKNVDGNLIEDTKDPENSEDFKYENMNDGLLIWLIRIYISIIVGG